jgi:hypothetical protein
MELTELPGFAGKDWSLQKVADSLAMWSVAIRRMATSGPESELRSARRFSDHPKHDRVGEDPLVRHRAHLDVIAYPTSGDITLWDQPVL